MPESSFSKGLTSLSSARTSLESSSNSAPSIDDSSQLVARLQLLHQELSEPDERSIATDFDFGKTDKELSLLIGECIESFGDQTGVSIVKFNMILPQDTLESLSEEHKALFGGIKSMLEARENLRHAAKGLNTEMNENASVPGEVHVLDENNPVESEIPVSSMAETGSKSAQ
jgi:hypothetical protein